MPSLLSLPVEVLEYICAYVAFEHNLYDLVLVSKYCYSIASKRRFAHIRINVTDRASLEDTAQLWSDLLATTSAFAAVRRLSVRGQLIMQDDDPYPDYSDDEDELTHMGEYYDRSINSLFDLKPEYGPDDAWEPLARLLRQLCGLQTLLWACETQFPSCLLQILHRQLQHCRLHIRAFKLPSLHQHSDSLHDIDARDFTLATSPNLASVVVPVSHYDTDGNVEYNEEAVMQMAAKMALNLAGVHIVHRGLGASPYYFAAVNRGRPPWRGFFLDDALDGRVEPLIDLQSWSLSPSNYHTFFRPWEKRLRFSGLRNIQLWEAGLETLMSIRSHKFSSLRALAISTEYPEDLNRHYSLEKAEQLDEAVGAFLLTIAPLQCIHLSGSSKFEKAFQVILAHHGSSLHTLSFVAPANHSLPGPQIATTLIDRIQAHCPNLRGLRVTITRTHGDADEIASYQALGGLTNLKDLTLQLRLANDMSSSPANVRNTLISAAVDETLVREIFQKIVKAGARSLQGLKVTIDPSGLTLRGFSDISMMWERHWKCIRLQNLENGEENVKVHVREVMDGITRKVLQEEDDGRYRLGSFEKPFRSLWPAKTGDWKYDWHSFPLGSDPPTYES